MSRPTIGRFPILWSLHRLFHSCETDCAELLREDNSDVTETAPETLAFFNCAYCSGDRD